MMEMDLVGLYINIFMNEREAFASIFGAPRADDSEDKNLILSGKVVGETPGVGLWVEVDGLTDVTDAVDDDDAKPVIPTLSEHVRPRLIRWEFISNACIFEDKPSRLEIRGFTQRG